MRTLIKISILFFLVVMIFGGAALVGYNLYLKPQKSAAGKSRQGVIPTPTPDFSASEFESLKASLQTASLTEKRAALESFLANYPNSARSAEARKMIGEWNMEEFFSPDPAPNKIEYVVKPGDSMARIASRHNASFDLIVRANNLNRLLIHPGDKFILPKGDFSLELAADGKTVTLKNGGAFFKEYPAISAVLPPNIRAEGLQVMEKIAWHDGKRVTFGDKNYLGSTRWISLSQPGMAIYSVIDDGTLPDVEKPPHGIQLDPADVEELFALVNRGTPVTMTLPTVTAP